MNRDSVNGFGIGLLVGAAVGASLALLFAPQSGRETRQMIKEKASNIRQRMSRLRGDGKEEQEEEAAEEV